MGRLRDLRQGDPTGDAGAAREFPAGGVETERPLVRVQRARERDLPAKAVVDHDDLLEERSPEHDAVGHIAEREVDPDERTEPAKAVPGDRDEGGVDDNRVVAARVTTLKVSKTGRRMSSANAAAMASYCVAASRSELRMNANAFVAAGSGATPSLLRTMCAKTSIESSPNSSVPGWRNRLWLLSDVDDYGLGGLVSKLLGPIRLARDPCVGQSLAQCK